MPNPYHSGGRRLTFRQWDESSAISVDLGDGGESETTIERIINGSAAILRNQTGAKQLEGTVVVIDVDNEESFVLSGDPAQTDRTVGVLLEDILSGERGLVQTHGYCALVFVTGAVAIGDKLYTTVGAQASADPDRETGAFAEALQANDSGLSEELTTGTDWKVISSSSDFSAPAGWHDVDFDDSGYAAADNPSDAAWVDNGSPIWMWSSTPTDQYLWTRKLVTLERLPTALTLLWASDGTGDIYINGVHVAGPIDGYAATQVVSIDPSVFVVGTNIIAIHCGDPVFSGAHGLYGVFTLTLAPSISALLWGAPDVQWVAMADGLVAWVNVQDYGAIEDNATDALAAFNAAQAALVAVGGGRFYMPGTGVGYLLSSGVDALTVPGIVMGDGVNTTVIHCSSATAHVFTSASPTRAPTFQEFSIVIDAATPTAGSAIHCSTGGNSALYRNLRIENAWVGIRHEDGAAWASEYVTMNGIKKYGYHISNADNPDEGDWRLLFPTLSTGASDTPDAGIRIDSSGGGQIIGLKVVSPSPNTGYLHGIDLAIAGSDATSILKVISPSIENIRGDAIHLTQTGTASYSQVSIIDLQTSLPDNDTGKAISAVAEDVGGIANITVVGGIFATNGTARSAMQFTNIDTVTIVVPQLMDNFTSSYTESGSTSITEVGGGASVLDDLSDVAIISPAENDTLRYIGGEWVNDIRRWEPVTFNFGTGPELVWDGDDLVMEWKAY